MNDDKKTELQDHFTHFVKAAHEEYLAAEENLTIAVG